ncbi:MAG: PIG-L family deacetylase [Roseiflexaceae bacterium]|nr:PIG-L family deacetylase [Roseiflexaceae bacterium]
MLLSDISQITDNYDHIYLSPHLDDAALSCGGAIARHSTRGARVLVVTLCTAVPPAEGPFSEFAAAMHSRWNLPADQVVATRLHEDAQALERIGADGLWAGFSDAIYRMPEQYNEPAKLFGSAAPGDPQHQQVMALLDDLHARAPSATFYSPLAIGGHVDHRIMYDATIAGGWGRSTAFYEDIPYVHQGGAIEQRMQQLPRPFVASIIDIDASLRRKLDAIAAYSSQMNELFGGEATMRAEIMAYHETLRPELGTHGERLWVMGH